MDISYWTQLNPNVGFEHTRKQYFKKYLYKLDVYAPGGRQIDHRMSSVREALDQRRSHSRSYNYGGSWRDQYDRHFLDSADPEFLELLRTLKRHNKSIKFRVEEPSVSIYAETIDDLKNIVGNFKTQHTKYIEKITYPANQQQVDLLTAGAILVSTPQKYSHKVILRDGRYSMETKAQILRYLEGLDDLVKVSKGSYDMLTKPYASMWGVFFYTNDPKVTTFLNLLSPGLVSNIHELIVQE
jgi:hypothetical protein